MAADPARPLLTAYDDATGERVELSVATTANWVAKTANLLTDGLGRAPGDRLALLLPLHWQAVIALIGGWYAGLPVQLGDPAGAEVVFAEPARLVEALRAGAADVVGVSLAPLGAGLSEPPPGVLDFATEVLGHADRAIAGPAPEPALRLPGAAPLGAAELLAAAEAGPAGVVLTTLGLDTLPGVLAGALTPLVTGGRAVLCRHLDPARLARRIAAERVTAVLGATPPAGARPAAGPPDE